MELAGHNEHSSSPENSLYFPEVQASQDASGVERVQPGLQVHSVAWSLPADAVVSGGHTAHTAESVAAITAEYLSAGHTVHATFTLEFSGGTRFACFSVKPKESLNAKAIRISVTCVWRCRVQRARSTYVMTTCTDSDWKGSAWTHCTRCRPCGCLITTGRACLARPTGNYPFYARVVPWSTVLATGAASGHLVFSSDAFAALQSIRASCASMALAVCRASLPGSEDDSDAHGKHV